MDWIQRAVFFRKQDIELQDRVLDDISHDLSHNINHDNAALVFVVFVQNNLQKPSSSLQQTHLTIITDRTP